MQEEVRRRRGRDRLVEDGELELIEGFLEGGLGGGGVGEAGGVGDATDEEALLLARAAAVLAPAAAP